MDSHWGKPNPSRGGWEWGRLYEVLFCAARHCTPIIFDASSCSLIARPRARMVRWAEACTLFRCTAFWQDPIRPWACLNSHTTDLIQERTRTPHHNLPCLPRILHTLPVASMTINFTLFSIDEDLVDQWRQSFFAIVPDKVRDRVSFVHTSLQQSNTIFDCLVSPANSFGRFDGGYGLAATVLMYS